MDDMSPVVDDITDMSSDMVDMSSDMVDMSSEIRRHVYQCGCCHVNYITDVPNSFSWCSFVFLLTTNDTPREHRGVVSDSFASFCFLSHL